MEKTRNEARKLEVQKLRQLDDAQLAQVTGGGEDTIQADTDATAKSGTLVYLNRTRQKE
jgi:hypothetical protein